MNEKLKLFILVLVSCAIYVSAYFLATNVFNEIVLWNHIPVLAVIFLIAFILSSLFIEFFMAGKSIQNFKRYAVKTLKSLVLISFLIIFNWISSNYLIDPYQLQDTIYEYIFSAFETFILVFFLMRIYINPTYKP